MKLTIRTIAVALLLAFALPLLLTGCGVEDVLDNSEISAILGVEAKPQQERETESTTPENSAADPGEKTESAAAQESDLSLRLDGEDTLTISGDGVLTVSGTNPPWSDYAGKIRKILIGEGITRIDYTSFHTLENLKSVTLGKSVTSIGAYAFRSCISLSEITIPVGVISIGEDAFDNCYSLTDVFYGGTEKQWSEMRIDSGNEALKTAKIHCSDSREIPVDESPARRGTVSVPQQTTTVQNPVVAQQLPQGRKRVYSKRKTYNFSIVVPANWTAKTEKVTETWDTPQTSEQFRCYDGSGKRVLDFDYQTTGVGVSQVQIVQNGVPIEYFIDNGIVYGGFLGGHIFNSYGLTQAQLTEILSTAEFYDLAEDFPIPTRTLNLNSYGDDVRYVQAALMEMNYDGLVVDGDYGKYTKDAVARFQKKHNMAATGIVDAATANELQYALGVWRQKH